jgi:hypothetical protein
MNPKKKKIILVVIIIIILLVFIVLWLLIFKETSLREGNPQQSAQELDNENLSSASDIEDTPLLTYYDTSETSIKYSYPKTWGDIKSYDTGYMGTDIGQYFLYFSNQPLNDDDGFLRPGELSSHIIFHSGKQLECNNSLIKKCEPLLQRSGLKKSMLIGATNNLYPKVLGDIDSNIIQIRWEIDKPSTYPINYDKLYFIVDYKYPEIITEQNIDSIAAKVKNLSLDDIVMKFLDDFELYIVNGYSFEPLLIIDSPKYLDRVNASHPIIITGKAKKFFKNGAFDISATYWNKFSRQVTVAKGVARCDIGTRACSDGSDDFANFTATLDLSSSPVCYLSISFFSQDERTKYNESNYDLFIGLTQIPGCSNE